MLRHHESYAHSFVTLHPPKVYLLQVRAANSSLSHGLVRIPCARQCWVTHRRDLDNDIVRMFQLGHVDLLDPDLMRSDIINRLHSVRGHCDWIGRNKFEQFRPEKIGVACKGETRGAINRRFILQELPRIIIKTRYTNAMLSA